MLSRHIELSRRFSLQGRRPVLHFTHNSIAWIQVKGRNPGYAGAASQTPGFLCASSLAEEDLAPDQEKFIEINAELAKQWPVITEKKDPLPDAEKWDGIEDKLKYLERCG